MQFPSTTLQLSAHLVLILGVLAAEERLARLLIQNGDRILDLNVELFEDRIQILLPRRHDSAYSRVASFYHLVTRQRLQQSRVILPCRFSTSQSKSIIFFRRDQDFHSLTIFAPA